MHDRTADPSAAPARRRPRGRAGFSFAEVLFAVIILGVGFIMVAAIFPVAIQQTQSTAEDAAAAAAAREAANVIASLPTTAANRLYDSTAASTPPSVVNTPNLLLFPPTVKNYVLPSSPPTPGAVPPPAIVVPFTGPRWELARGNLINPSDPRYAYVPFYRRENGSPLAQLIVVAVASRDRTVFAPKDDAALPLSVGSNYFGPAATTAPHAPPTADTLRYKVCPDTVTITGTPPSWVGEGCYLPTNGNGRSYRLGHVRSAASPFTTYELDAGDSLALAPGLDGLWGTPDDVTDVATTSVVLPPAALQPIAAYASTFRSAGAIAGRITLSVDLSHVTGNRDNNVPPPAAVPGTYVIIADDYPYDVASPTNTSYPVPLNAAAAPLTAAINIGALNGRLFRLGQPVPADASATPHIYPGTFELDPAYGMRPPAGGFEPDAIPISLPTVTYPSGAPWARAYLVGAGRTNVPAQGDSAAQANTTLTTHSGPAQDVGVFTTLFPVQ